jgi:membrane protein involved in colicin uptake
MTTGEPSRLEQIERILLQVAEQQQQTQEQQQRTQEQQHQFQEQQQQLQEQQKQFQEQQQRTQGLVDANAAAITRLEAAQARTQKNLDNLIEETLQMFGDSIAQADQDRAIMREMQSEVRGLQTENRRIFEVLRRRNPGNGNGSGEG